MSDEQGKELVARAQLSDFAAKRLLITIRPDHQCLDFYELNIDGSQRRVDKEYIKNDNPTRFDVFEHDMIVGGACIDGNRFGSITSKLANFRIWNYSLAIAKAEALLDYEKNELARFYGKESYPVAMNAERRRVFKDDVTKLDTWMKKLEDRSLSNLDVGEASVILYKWLLDRHPLLQDLCNELGIQLTFPIKPKLTGLEKQAILGIDLRLGRRSPLGYKWGTRKDVLQQELTVIRGFVVTLEKFVKFIRHKLGGGHFDVAKREKWQRELLELSGYLVQEHDFMRWQMGEIVRLIRDTVREHRIEERL